VKVYKLTVMVIDHDGVGDEMPKTLENGRLDDYVWTTQERWQSR
jgi:hypothetical protein